MIKTLVLLRHGQYSKKPKEKLTAVGRKQAQLAGKRLRDMRINSVSISTMPRAQETGALVLKKLNKKYKVENCDYLRECVPGFPKKDRKKFGYTDVRQLKKDQQQADKAFAKYFKYSKKSKTHLLVCHGNIIRYLICKALNISTDKWLCLDIKQCGISIVQLNYKKKSMSVISHNDIGHIPLKIQTFI